MKPRRPRDVIPLSICSARLPGLGAGRAPGSERGGVRGRNWGGGEGSEGDER